MVPYEGQQRRAAVAELHYWTNSEALFYRSAVIYFVFSGQSLNVNHSHIWGFFEFINTLVSIKKLGLTETLANLMGMYFLFLCVVWHKNVSRQIS